MPEKWVLRQYQSLPLHAKVGMTMSRIIEWHDHFNGDVCISFSGGKDSTVLAHLVHDFYPDVPLVFANTGLEYPEIQSFARKMGAVFVRPKMSFSEVISQYGYPIISKENAETIYYARRIRNKVDHGIISGGGTATALRKRTELHGCNLAYKEFRETIRRLGNLQQDMAGAEQEQTGMTGDESPLPG